jgi:N-acetylmuramoyl-L-alanine amidase
MTVFFLASVSFGNTLKDLNWESDSESFRFSIEAKSPILFTISDSVENGGFFQIDLLEITTTYKDRTINPGDPRTEKIEIISYSSGNFVRIKIYPEKGVHWNVVPPSNPVLVQVELKGKTNLLNTKKQKTPVKENRSSSSPLRSVKKTGIKKSSGISRKTVIIDPGHGGFNKGCNTFWKIKGKHYLEKNLVLGYSKKLKYLIDKSPNLKAVMTRDKDEYVSLGDRVEISEKSKGDVFISYHLNAAPSRKSATARGVEFFHWSEKGSDRSAGKYLEKLENDQLLPKLPGTQNRRLKNILTSMLKDALEEEKVRSANLCEAMWEVFGKNSYFKKYHRKPPVKSARFVVCANYAMPAILIEVGFLTNRYEAKYLITESFQWTVARLTYNGIQKFFAKEDPGFKPHYLKY